MYFDRLEKNLIDIIKEEQAKLGFRKEAIRLYFLKQMILKLKCLQGFLDFRLLLRKSWEMSRLRLKKTASAFIFRKTAASMCMSIPMPTNLSAVW